MRILQHLLVFAAAIQLVACSESVTAPPQTNAAKVAASLKDKYAWVGKTHNEGMAYIIGEVYAARDAGKVHSYAEALAVANSACRVFLGTHHLDTDACSQLVPKVAHAESRIRRLNSRTSMTLDDYVAALNNIVSTANIYLIPDQVDGLLGQASGELGSDDLEVFAAAASVASSSPEYWYSNPPDGFEGPLESPFTSVGTLHPQASFVMMRFDWRRCAVMDLAGAVGGGLAALILKASVPGGALAGAVSASAFDAVAQSFGY